MCSSFSLFCPARRIGWLFVFTAVCLVWTGRASAQSRTAFLPDTGRNAPARCVRDLHGALGVLMVAIRPGQEDLPTLAYLRLHSGYRIGVVYLTNGESLPDDIGYEEARRTVGTRKEEATAVATLFDWHCRFLNFIDPGPVADTSELSTVWNRDSLRLQLADVLTDEAPDVVMIAGSSTSGPSDSKMESYVCAEILRINRLQESRRKSLGTEGHGHVFTIREIVSGSEGRGKQFSASTRVREPLSGKTIQAISDEGAGLYRSLRFQLKREPQTAGRYGLVYSQSRKTGPSLERGLPFESPRVRQIAVTVDQFCARAEKQQGRSLLKPLSAVIDTLDRAIRLEAITFTPPERKQIGKWKRAAEDLRCSLLDLHVYLTFQEPVISTMTLFILKFDSMKVSVAGGSTQILFPKESPQFIINESDKKTFPFSTPSTFEILSQKDLVYDTPAFHPGILLRELGTSLLYAIVHRAPERENNFIYQREIPLRVAPRHTFDLVNERIRAVPRQSLEFEAENYSRDLTAGDVQLKDSIFLPSSKHFVLPTRYSSVRDTMTVQLKAPLAPGTYLSRVDLGGGLRTPFLVESFDVAIDSSKAVGFISAFGVSALSVGFSNLGMTWRRFGYSDAPSSLKACNVLIIDRESGSAADSLGAQLTAWVAAGGHLIVLPQFTTDSLLAAIAPGAGFIVTNPTLKSEVPLLEAGNQISRTPNVLTANDWDGWLFAKAFGTIRLSSGGSWAVLLKNKAGEPLVASTAAGKGRVTLVALNADAQLANVVPGAYRVFANLIAL